MNGWESDVKTLLIALLSCGGFILIAALFVAVRVGQLLERVEEGLRRLPPAPKQ